MNGLHNKNTELHNNSDKNSEKVTSIQDQKADEIKNSDGNESKSECCNPIITEADEIDALWYKTQDFYSYRMDKEMFNTELLALKERWEREARIDELEGFCGHSNEIPETVIKARIAQLGGKDE